MAQENVEKAIVAMYGYEEHGESGVIDLLTDLLHYCHTNKIDYDRCVTRARRYFEDAE